MFLRADFYNRNAPHRRGGQMILLGVSAVRGRNCADSTGRPAQNARSWAAISPALSMSSSIACSSGRFGI